jgi:predicted ferric reductase
MPGRATMRRAPTPAPNARSADLLAGAAGVGLAITAVLTLQSDSLSGLGAAGGIATALGRLAGMIGAYLMAMVVLLVARIPALESVVGQDRLVRWHRKIGPWPIALIALHGGLITVGYAQADRSGTLHEAYTLLASYPGVLAATVGFALLLMAGVSSYRRVRRRMAYETWWSIHLYTYIALALSFSHQLSTGAAFVGHPVARAYWIGLWAGSAAIVLGYRVLLPLYRSLRHSLVVERIEHEGAGCVSVVCRGRALERLGLRGGQFLQWRFLKRGMWWQAHPYSVSAMPTTSRIRLTAKDLGDHSAALAALRPGTRIAIEGPYGAFTKQTRRSNRLLLIGAGVGITPLRALLEDLPATADVSVVLRASTEDELVLRSEIHTLVAELGGQVAELIGSRDEVSLDAGRLRDLVPDLSRRDLYVCGPQGFTEMIISAAIEAGLARNRVHVEEFVL